MAKTKAQKATDALENLKAALKILKDEDNWIQNSLAAVPVYDEEYEDGNVTKEIMGWVNSDDPTDPEATKFCALGAVQHVDGPGEKLATDFLIEAAGLVRIRVDDCPQDELAEDEDDIFAVNDDIGYDETLEMFKKAIALAKKAIKANGAKAKAKSKSKR